MQMKGDLLGYQVKIVQIGESGASITSEGNVIKNVHNLSDFVIIILFQVLTKTLIEQVLFKSFFVL